MMLKYYCSFLLIFMIGFAKGQQVQLLHSGNRISLRGLSVVDNNTIWVSGNKGMVGKSLDGGNTWKWLKVKGFDSTDFRDIEAFNDTTAIIMSVAEPAYILKTTDGGVNWKVVYENKTKGMFLDAMDFWDDKNGFVVGDPIHNNFFIAYTTNAGNKWKQQSAYTTKPKQQLAQQGKLSETKDFISDSAEACFASSGTNIRMISDKSFVLVTGGSASSVFINNKKSKLPLLQGKESTGANSIAINKNTIIVVGGDFTSKDATDSNCCYSTDAGKTWQLCSTAPHGYRSCVEYLEDKTWISCGLNGVDISVDNGKNWNLIDTDSFNSCRKAKHGRAVFFVGSNGRIGKLSK